MICLVTVVVDVIVVIVGEGREGSTLRSSMYVRPSMLKRAIYVPLLSGAFNLNIV